MAKLSYNNYQQTAEASYAPNDTNVGFFTLRNDGDEAIVRFMHSSTDDFDICTVHPIEIPTDKVKFRNVDCLRKDANEPIENCPFCAAGIPLTNRLYIHLIQYIRDDTGKIVPSPMIWERSMSYAHQLKSLMDEYGPLPNVLFKIKRSGAAGSRDTKYSIMFASPNVYPAERYPLINDPFVNYSVVGHGVMKKSVQDMIFFIQSGSFPTVSVAPKTEPVAQQPVMPPMNTAAPAYTPVTPKTPNFVPPVQTAPAAPVSTPYTPPVNQAPVYTSQAQTPTPVPNYSMPSVQAPTAPQTYTPGTGNRMPWEEAAPTASDVPVKPVRYY